MLLILDVRIINLYKLKKKKTSIVTKIMVKLIYFKLNKYYGSTNNTNKQISEVMFQFKLNYSYFWIYVYLHNKNLVLMKITLYIGTDKSNQIEIQDNMFFW